MRIAREASRFNVLACGRRFGKTTFGVDRLLPPALLGYPVAWFAPTYKLLLEVWREALKYLAPVVARKDTQQRRIELVTGGVVEMWSLDGGTVARGRKYKRIVIDEAAMCALLEMQWNEEIRPTLTDYEGDAWFLSTPKGLNFFRQLFLRGQDPLQPAYQSWQMPTLTNPFIKPSEIESARGDLPELTFEQEYLARFLENAGAVFRNLLNNLTKVETCPAEHAGHEIVLGLDWGQKRDFTVISALCITCRREVELLRFNQVGWAFQRERVADFCQKWKVQGGLVESNSIGGPNLEALVSEGLPLYGFETTGQSKPPLIQSLALTFEREEFKWVDSAVATGELEAYESQKNDHTGRISYSAPRGMHDDTVIARALARQAAMLNLNGTAEHGGSLW
ncbi:MAG TPA: hypothetical protein VK422_01320 [Pyrinomonadaceae bacterium]|nr:hypothetical protein [Pyrinomonadaceae bacterium]